MKNTALDFSELAKILDDNRNAKISDSHWCVVSKMMKLSGKRYITQEKALVPTIEDLHRPFTI